MTPEEADALFKLAFKLERRGDREAAIEIYDRLAKELPADDNGSYAANCASKLRGYEEIAAGPPEPEIDGNYWRDGELIIIRNGTTLPKRCIKSNETEDLWPSTLNLTFLPIGAGIFFWFALPVIGSLAGLIICPTKITIHVALNLKHWRRRNVARLLFWACLPLLSICVIAAFSTKDNILRIFLIILAVITIITGRICDTFFVDPVSVKWLRGSFAEIKGANPEFIATLPQWPLVWGNGQWQTRDAAITNGYTRGGGRVWDNGWVTRAARVILVISQLTECPMASAHLIERTWLKRVFEVSLDGAGQCPYTVTYQGRGIGNESV